ncbi:MAG TPA: hypothetical protein VLX29_08420 [Nitrospirota bacterium]|nr:hypothetical protein [Nitrospirota bacterium]
MFKRYPNPVDLDSPKKEQNNEERRSGARIDDTCRCKEASEMTPGQLLKLMLNDLSFWKKGQKG